MNSFVPIVMLWRQAASSLREHWQPLLIGMVLFGCATAIVQQRTTELVHSSMNSAMLTAGLDQEVITRALDTGGINDTEALFALIEQQQDALTGLSGLGQVAALQQSALIMIQSLLPIIATALIIIGIITYLAMQFYFVMTINVIKVRWLFYWQSQSILCQC